MTSPEDELPASAKDRSLPWWMIALLAVVHGAGAVLVMFVLPGPDDVPQGIVFLAIAFGLLYAQVSLLAVWTVFGPWRLALRITSTLFAVVILSAILTFYVVRSGGNVGIGIAGGVLMFVQCLLIQVPLFLARTLSGWRIGLNRAGHHEGARHAQFGIGHILLWTAGIAALLGVGRFLFSGVSTSGFVDPHVGEWAMFFAFFTLFNICLAIPTIWVCVGHRLHLLFIPLLIYVPLLTAAQWLTFQSLPNGDRISEIQLFVILNLVHTVALGGTLLLLRARGLRWYAASDS